MLTPGMFYLVKSMTIGGVIGESFFSTTVRANKGKVLLVVPLAEVDQSAGDDVDPEPIMRAHGWRRMTEEEIAASKVTA